MSVEIDERVGAGAVASGQQGAAPLTVFAAPATGDEFNTLGERLVPKGCFKVEDLLFDFDSSFVRPEIGAHLPALAKLRTENKVGELFPPLAIFGHADPVGNDDLNKRLSGRRAVAMYAMLVRDVDLWEDLFANPFGDDKWGTRAIQTMLSTVQTPIGIDGQTGDETRGAIKTFQDAHGLAADGVAGPNTRKVLFRAYMDALCGPGLVLDKKKDFLAQNADGSGLKGDVQGCSEFNPLMLFSKQEAAAFEKSADKTARNKENAPNRRVMILLFAPGRRVKPAIWPCPRVKEGVGDCKKRFFPDATTRRSFQDARREFETTKDTFACRFYQIISDGSPCERVKPPPPVPPIPPIPPIPPKDAVLPIIFFPEREPVAAGASTPADSKALAGSPAKGAPVGATAIAPATSVVVVHRPYMPTARVDVDLKTDKPFDGTGTFTISTQDKIRFFFGPKQLQFDGKDNVFTGDELQIGVTLFAEGAQASSKMDDVVLTLTLAGGSKKAGPPATAKMTALDVTLDILEPIMDVTKPIPPLPQPAGATAPPNAKDKVFGGRGLPAQDEAKTCERAQLLVRQIKPADFAGKLVLTALSDQVRAFVDGTPTKDEKPLPKRHVFPATDVQKADRRFFAEGVKVSTKVRDTGFHLGVEGIQEDADKVSITVVHAEIVSTVKPSELQTIARVPEKPERKTKSQFFPAPLIIGVNYDVSLRPHLELPQPDGPIPPLKLTWASRVPADRLAVTDLNKEVVKLKAKKPSTAVDDTVIDLLVEAEFGKFKRSHRFTRVNVEIDPVRSGDTLTTASDINTIINPSATIILQGAEAADPKLTAKVEITKIEPPSIFTDDDDRIAWWIIGGETKQAGKATYEGRAEFMNTEAAKRGTKIQIFGTGGPGDILVQPYSGGFGYGMFRSHVVPLRKLKYRVNRIFTSAKPAAPPKPAIPARVPTASHNDARSHITILNIYLRQAGLELIPDDSNLMASSGGTANVGVASLNKHIVSVTQSSPGHFDVEVKEQALTFNATISDAANAVRINGRNALIVFAYMVSEAGTAALARAQLSPKNNAPGQVVRDKGIPSSSLIKKTGLPGDTPVSEVRMTVGAPLLVSGTPLMWGVSVGTRAMDNASTPGAARIQFYGVALAHEVGHVLGLNHRGDLSDPFSDTITTPRGKSLMFPNADPPTMENLDIVQVKAIRLSEVLNHNP